MSKYFIVLFLSIVMPLILSFYPPLGFWKNYKALIKSIALIMIIFGMWDIYATYRGHWVFRPYGLSGIYIINLPLEEVLFFVVIPFCCLFTWEAMKYIKGNIK